MPPLTHNKLSSRKVEWSSALFFVKHQQCYHAGQNVGNESGCYQQQNDSQTSKGRKASQQHTGIQHRHDHHQGLSHRPYLRQYTLTPRLLDFGLFTQAAQVVQHGLKSVPREVVRHACSSIKFPKVGVYSAISFLRRSVSMGTILWRSPTMPRSATLKMGANLSLLMAIMKSLSSIPARCWMAPLIPQAM